VESRNHHFDLIKFKRRLPDGKLSGGDLIVEIGRLFIGTPYGAGTLDHRGKEKLSVNFHQFDCMTFVETVLALSCCVGQGKPSPGEFRRALQFIRYRRGVLSGYSSRLHYFTDWLRDNEKKKLMKDISHFLTGEPGRKKINYMTTHRQSYPVLGNEKEFYQILQTEKNLSRRIFSIIGKVKISAQKANIKNGDIIAITSNQEGLDVAHIGFALWQRGNPHLLHASSNDGAVVISKKTLAAYVKQNKNFSGIIVARPL
jgi:hypothetical protein